MYNTMYFVKLQPFFQSKFLPAFTLVYFSAYFALKMEVIFL
jgi:hypothetical protein